MKWIPSHKPFHFDDNNSLECLPEEDTETHFRLSRGGGGVLGKGQDQLPMPPWAEEKEAKGHMTCVCPP